MIAPPQTSPALDWYTFLGRAQLPLPGPDVLSPLRDASILITGAGGSIGGALALRITGLSPRALVLLDASEQALYRLEAQLSELGIANRPHIVLGNVTDTVLLDEILRTHKPQILFHAAAYKHSPMLESHPLAALANNALGTYLLAQRASQYGSPRIVLLSTDKAVEPASMLGASKRIAEQIVLAHNGVVMRLCNVLGSEGSVVDRFLQQLASHQHLTITDPDAARYFLTCEEAVNLLMIAATKAPERSLLIPHLTMAHSIVSLAKFLAGPAEPTIRYTGLRPGDKLTEQLYSAEEQPLALASPGMLQLQSPATDALSQQSNFGMLGKLGKLASAIERRDLDQALDAVGQLVPNYRPSSTLLSQLGAQQGVQRS